MKNLLILTFLVLISTCCFSQTAKSATFKTTTVSYDGKIKIVLEQSVLFSNNGDLYDKKHQINKEQILWITQIYKIQ